MAIRQNFKKYFKRDIHILGHYILAFGVTLAVLFTLSNPTQLSVNQAIFLLLLGVVVGFIDVPKKEANSFILATIAIIVASLAHYEQISFALIRSSYPLGYYIKGILLNASIFLSPAMLIVGFKIIYRVYIESK